MNATKNGHALPADPKARRQGPGLCEHCGPCEHCAPALSDEAATLAADCAFQDAFLSLERAVAKLEEVARTGKHRVGREARSMACVLNVLAEHFVMMQTPLRVDGKWIR